MKLESAVTSVFFESDTLKQEITVEALEFFVEKLRATQVKIDAVYPGDPFALPFAMFLSNKLSVPIKTEKFLKMSETILVVFSYPCDSEVTENYVGEKLRIFRKRFPRSPALAVASSKLLSCVDFQLLKVENFEKVNSYRFLSEARRNFFYPVEGEFTHYTSKFWELSKKEISIFERAKRIMDSARRYLKEEKEKLGVLDSEPEIAIWERFRKGILVEPRRIERKEAEFSIKLERLIEVEDRSISSAVASLLEFLSQSLEAYFPVHLAYSGPEVLEREGVLIVPHVTEVMGGADIQLEIILRSPNIEKDFVLLADTVHRSLESLFKGLFDHEGFKPSVDSILDAEIKKATFYISWFLDGEMVKAIQKKINKRWLLSRLLYRKKLKSSLKDAIKILKNFRFTPENFEYVFANFEAVWKKNPAVLRLYRREIKEILDENDLWGLVGVYGIKVWNARSKVSEELLNFFLSLKGYENVHHLLAREDRYFAPVLTKRIYRPNWEKVIREEQEVFLKAEPLNPESPVTYALVGQDGCFLGTVPEILGHYISAKEASGKKIKCSRLYFDPVIFSENSYWVEIRCL